MIPIAKREPPFGAKVFQSPTKAELLLENDAHLANDWGKAQKNL